MGAVKLAPIDAIATSTIRSSTKVRDYIVGQRSLPLHHAYERDVCKATTMPWPTCVQASGDAACLISKQARFDSWVRHQAIDHVGLVFNLGQRCSPYLLTRLCTSPNAARAAKGIASS